MLECETCGGDEFEKHDGFMYCMSCQTQSLDYHEQAFEFNESSVVKRSKTGRTDKKGNSQKVYDDGFWTSWEAFTFILRGMTDELKQIENQPDFELLVFRIWAAYLKEQKVVFISRCSEKTPRLWFFCKPRDARILYDVDMKLSHEDSKKRSRSVSTRSSMSTYSTWRSKRISMGHKKRKLVQSDYEEYLSSLEQASNLANESLESLGRSSQSEASETSEATSDSRSSMKSVKEVLKQEDYQLFKDFHKSKTYFMYQKDKAATAIEYVGKNKLLSILHLACLMSGSDIQLSDLLRFIREGHLSFAKVTHFLPHNIKFPKQDSSFIDVTKDGLMPTHLRQRQITSQLANYIKVASVPTPNVSKLIDRYCDDLNLPSQVKDFCKKIVLDLIPSKTRSKVNSPLPSFEARAMVSIVFVLKLLFGINGKTEVFLSKLARDINRTKRKNEKELFVFEDWQKFIECRKTMLNQYHYPTQERLEKNVEGNSDLFLDMLLKESKDEQRNNRFVRYSRYYIKEHILESVKYMLKNFTKTQDLKAIYFPPSLTPMVCCTKTFFQNLPEELESKRNTLEDILNKSYKHCDVSFALEPKSYLAELNKEPNGRKSSGCVFKDDFLMNYSSKYWVMKYPNSTSSRLENFKEEVLEKTPINFQWLMTECSIMLEMNVRDVYDELLKLENRMIKAKKKNVGRDH